MHSLLITSVFYSTLLMTLHTTDEWPRFAGPAGDNTSTETNLTHEFPDSGPPILWSTAIQDGYSGAAVRDGEVYFFDRLLGEKDILRVLDLETGEELWRFEHDVPGRLMFPGARSVPTVEEDLVYMQSGFGPIYCVNRESHELEWTVDVVENYGGDMPMFGYSNSPLIYEGVVVVAPLGAEVGLVALDRFSGELLWKTKGVGSNHSTPCILNLLGEPQILMMGSEIDPSVFAQEEGAPPMEPPPGMLKAEPVDSIVPVEMADMKMPGQGFLHAYSLEGDLLWKTEAYYCSTPIPTPLRVDDKHIFLTGGYGAGSVLLQLAKSESGEFKVEELFRHEKGAQIHLPLLHEDHLYLLVNENSNDPRTRRKQGGLMCMDLEGNEKWRTGAEPYFGRGAMIMADGMLIVQDGRNGTLRLINPNSEKYDPIAEANIFGIQDRKDHQMWAPMALAGGRLLMRSQGELKCVDLRAN